jgi:hypothetical protein
MHGPEETDADDIDLTPAEPESDPAEQIEEEGEPAGANFV